MATVEVDRLDVKHFEKQEAVHWRRSGRGAPDNGGGSVLIVQREERDR